MDNAIRADRAHVSGKVIPANRVRVVDPAAPNPTADGEDLHEPQITLVKESGAVRAIIVTCPCGRQTRLECEY